MTETFSAFKVNKVNWASSNVQYYIMFHSDRLVFVKIGGQFADMGMGVVVGGVLGGAVGGLIGSAVDSRLNKRKIQKKGEIIQEIFDKNVDEILAMDKKNYQIMYDDIKKAEIKKTRMGFNGARSGVLTIDTGKQEKFDIVAGQDFAFCEQIVQEHLGDKL
jgi:gas vesicle protein